MSDDMTQQELRVAITAAQYILDKVESGCELERWQISKIVLASDYLSSVHAYMCAYEEEMSTNGSSSSEEDSEPEDEEDESTNENGMVFVLSP